MTKTLALTLLALLLVAWLPATGADAPASQPAKELALDLGNGASLKLVLIPAGKFLMGSPETEKDRGKNEIPHEVTISKPFYLGVTHVTVDQFTAFVKDTGYQTDAEKEGRSATMEITGGKPNFRQVKGCSWRNPGFDQKGDHPVVQISWNDAQAFAAWLSKKSGMTVMLPTEAQWEYACRAGTTTAYPWGDRPDQGKGWTNCADQSLKSQLANGPVNWTFFPWDDGFVFTSPVESFKPNALGLYDMIGDARQWCQDRYGDYKKGAATDPAGADAGPRRVLRGGSWNRLPEYCRSAFRDGYDPGMRGEDFGFRVAVVASPAAVHCIVPYRHMNMWVFDDPRVGITREPFVKSADTIIDALVAHIPHATGGFRLWFSAAPFPGYTTKLLWRREELHGNWYFAPDFQAEGWLCPELFQYFDKAPPEIYVQAEPKS
jgi:formylglycine-generating enzyme required for sulfatase activity